MCQKGLLNDVYFGECSLVSNYVSDAWFQQITPSNLLHFLWIINVNSFQASYDSL